MQESAHGHPQLGDKIVKEFNHNGLTFIYDYDHPVYSYQQGCMATAVYQYQIDRSKKQASNSLQEYLATQSGNYNVWVLSYILLKKDAAGVVLPFPTNPDTMGWEQSEQFKFCASLPMKYEEDIEMVIKDFFSKPSRFMTGSILHGQLTEDFVKNIASIYQDMMAKEQSLLDFQKSINLQNLNGVSSNPEAVATSGSLPEEMQQDSKQPAI